MINKGIKGPIFVSIGDSEQLATFLENNPKIPTQSILVDNLGLKAYKSLGFEKIGENPKNAIKGTLNMKMPTNINFKEYLKTVQNDFNSRSKNDFKERVPSLAQLGGTIAVNKNNIVFFYEEGVPGDNANPLEVLKSLES